MEGRGDEPAEDDWTRSPAQIAPVCTWLASDAARDITGQIFNVMRGTLGIMHQPAVIRSFQAERLWMLADLDRVMPELMRAKHADDERAKREAVPEKI